MPCFVVSPNERVLANVERPGLANIAATVLDLMGFAAPDGYLPSLLA